MVCRRSWFPFCSLLLAASTAAAYEVPIADTDYDRQICSGMWGGKNTYINGVAGFLATYMFPLSSVLLVTFDAASQGQLATVIYEWRDVSYLGKDTSHDEDLPVSSRLLSAAHFLNTQYIAEDLRLHLQCQEGRVL